MSSSVEAVCVPPDRVGEVWPSVVGMIRAAMERGAMADCSEVEADVLQGDALLWLAWDGKEILAAAVTYLQGDGERKFCLIAACGGKDKSRWLPLLNDLERFAISEGCHSMKVKGRKGWLRALDGYKLSRVVLEKELG